MLKVLMVGADQYNATDGVIVKGIKELLDKALGKYLYAYHFLNDHELEPYEDSNLGTDLVVVCGTPWVWDNFQNSVKYANLMDIFQKHKDTPKIFMGAGSCISITAGPEILSRPQEQEGIRALFGFDNTTVITRDSIAYAKLIEAGVNNILLPCPAYYCYGDNYVSQSESRNVLIWADPKQTISAVDWQDESKLNKYYELMLKFQRLEQAEVYCANESDVLGAMQIGLPKPAVLSSYWNTMDLMLQASKVLSARVHCAVPAAALSKRVAIVPLDSRHRVLTEFGVKMANIEGGYPVLTRPDLAPSQLFVEDYVDIIRGVVDHTTTKGEV